MTKTLTRQLGCGAASAIALVVATPALAQTAPPTPADQAADQPAAADAKPDDAGAIVVTGSRIRGIAPVGSNVISIGQDKIADEPVTSTNDLLRRVPQVVSLGANRQGGSAQNGAANSTREAGINLRGLSTNATLVLYDGKRISPQGTQGQLTDPAIIPSIALDRIEVVADGSSAIYGSDAIAGVVNLITRRNFNGAEVKADYGFTDGHYSERQLSAIVGHKWTGGSAMLAGEYTHNNALFGRQLPFYQDNNAYRGGRDLRVSNCDPGTISVGGSTYAIPAGGVTAANVGSLVKGTSNKCFYNGYDTVIPEQDRYSVIGNISQEITPGLRVFADGFYSYSQGTIAGMTNISATVKNTNPFFVSPVAGATSETVLYSLIPTNAGEDVNPYHRDAWNLMAGIEGQLFGDFKATAYYAHGASGDFNPRTVGVNTGALNAALADTNPATALNVFGGPNNPATIAKIRDNLFKITGSTRLDVVNGQVDGSLFELPGGKVRVAVGGEHRVEYTYTNLTTGKAATPLNVTDAGSRNVTAVFGELFIPIVGASNAMAGIQQLSLSVAGRFEHYSDFGNTTNPKIGVTYKPVQAVSLRGSYGTSFRAPTFTEVSTIAGGAGLYYDTLPGANGNLTGIGIAGGNPGLKPETARTFSFGGDVAPLRGLRATINYFDIDYKNQIIALRGTPGILTNPLYASFVTFNPTAAQVSALVGSGLPINNAINQNVVQFIVDGRRQNLGRAQVRGFDFGLYGDWSLGNVKFDAGFQGTYFTKYLFQAVPGAAVVNAINTINFPQKFRSQSDLGVKWGPIAGRVTWNHLSGYLNNSLSPAQAVSAYDTLDLSMSTDVTEHFRIGVQVRNLFDKNPPFVDTTRGYDPQSSNPIPRLVAITAAAKF